MYEKKGEMFKIEKISNKICPSLVFFLNRENVPSANEATRNKVRNVKYGRYFAELKIRISRKLLN